MKPSIRNVLASRYASTSMAVIWGAERKIILERKLWVAGLRGQRTMGLGTITNEAITAYESKIEEVNLESIWQRELETGQDVKARIEEFNALAGFELIHQAFTSRDLTDNVEQLQIREALLHVRDRTVAVLERLGRRAAEFALLDLCGRSHNVPGQTITLGKRITNWAEELLMAVERLETFIKSYRLRGIKGAMGTQQDMADLLRSPGGALVFEQLIVQHLGFERIFDSVGQVYPRSLDFATVGTLVELASASGNFALMVRLMAGHDLIHEGVREGQTFSSAMPHKLNSRTCERIRGLVNVLCGFHDMTSRLVGDQWLEGDVSCSVVRRVALPDAFFTFDGICESVLHVLDEMEVFPAMIAKELAHYLPFLSSTRLLMAGLKAGDTREQLHAIIKKHALASINAVRRGEANPFVSLLSEDTAFPLTRAEVEAVIAEPNHGAAPEQVEKVCSRITAVTARYPEAATYVPEPML